LELGDRLFAERSRNSQVLGIELVERGRLRLIEREERQRSPILLERHGKSRQTRARRNRSDFERALLADEAIGLVDGEDRRCGSPGDYIESDAGEDAENGEYSEAA
jgi:hypothetical protein